MDRIKSTFKAKKQILNVFVTAGYPALEDTVQIVQDLDKNGVDMVEIGMPFSDPLADGPTIQESSSIAIKNGITLEKILAQVKKIRRTVDIPIVLMGYFNQLMQYGVEKFVVDAKDAGVDGLILPDLPVEIYEKEYQDMFEKHNMKISFLITPQTTTERVRRIADASSGFLYVVSSFSITGGAGEQSAAQLAYFNRIQQLELHVPALIGFGIHNQQTFETACQYVNGAIIGSAFIRAIKNGEQLEEKIEEFVKNIRKRA